MYKGPVKSKLKYKSLVGFIEGVIQMPPKSVDAYVKSLPPEQAEIVSVLRQLVRAAAPTASEAFKWAQPVYEENGPFAYIKAFKSYVNFGFWRGVDIPDPENLLQGGGTKMKHVKVVNAKDIRKKAFQDMVRAAVQLNRTKGDPTKAGTK